MGEVGATSGSLPNRSLQHHQRTHQHPRPTHRHPRPTGRAALAIVLADVLGADELGGAVTLGADVEPEGESEAEEDRINDAKLKLVGVAAAVQNCCTSASAEASSEGQAVKQVGRQRCTLRG